MGYKSNAKEVATSLERKRRAAQRGMVLGVKQGLQDFEGKIVREQYSGQRVGGRLGLNRQSGNLAGSWRVHMAQRGLGVRGTLGTRVKYAAIHEFGGTIVPKKASNLTFKTSSGWVSTKEVNMPKRTFVRADFRRSGLRLLKARVVRNVKRVMGS